MCCPVLQLRAGLSADVVPGGKPGPRRTKPLVIADAVGPALQRKGDLLANQDTCLSALRGEMPSQFDCILYNNLVIFIGLPVFHKFSVISEFFSPSQQ